MDKISMCGVTVVNHVYEVMGLSWIQCCRNMLFSLHIIYYNVIFKDIGLQRVKQLCL